jgi:plastocyanin
MQVRRAFYLGAYFAAGVLAAGALFTTSGAPNPQSTGTIQGRVTLAATPPPNPVIRMGADPNCLKQNAGKRVSADIILRSDDGGLQNVYVDVQGTPAGGGGGKTLTLDQQGCMYHPRVIGAQVGDTLVVKNDDPTLHNIHSLSKKYNINVSQPTAGMTYNVPLKEDEIMLHVKCNVHPWMTGFIGIAPNSYWAMSDQGGKFTISNVPAGSHTVQAWHEAYGFITQTVDVKAGGTTTVELKYTGNEKPSAAVRELEVPEGVTSVKLTRAGE